MPIDWNAPADEAPVRILTRVVQSGQKGRGGPESGGLESIRRPKSTAERIERLEAGIRSRVEAMPANRRPDEKSSATGGRRRPQRPRQGRERPPMHRVWR